MNRSEIIFYATIGAIIIIALAIFFFGRSTKRGGVGSKPLDPKDLPNSGSGIPAGWSPSVLAEKLYKNLSGYNWTLSPNGALFQEFATLQSDDMVAAVALDYRNRYGRSLYGDIDDEMAVGIAEKSEYWKGMALARLQKVNML